MYISHIVVVLSLIEFANTHYAEVEAPWKIQSREAHSFLKAPTRNKRSDPRCNTDAHYCEAEAIKANCIMHNEQTREHYCGQGHTCTATQACYLATPCPEHYTLGCTDYQGRGSCNIPSSMALKQAREMITSYSMGSRGTTSYIVLMHDGLSTDRNEAFDEAQIIKSMGIPILSVGIGQSFAYTEMLEI